MTSLTVRGLLLMGGLLVGWSAPRATADTPSWRRYQNARFGYSVSYPADRLTALPESDNGDGRRFQAIRGGAAVAVWAGYETELSLARIADQDELTCATRHASYKVVRSNRKPPFMALSCVKPDGQILYEKALRCKDVVTQIQFTYPLAEAAAWAGVVKGMSDSLGAGCGIG